MLPRPPRFQSPARRPPSRKPHYPLLTTRTTMSPRQPASSYPGTRNESSLLRQSHVRRMQRSEAEGKSVHRVLEDPKHKQVCSQYAVTRRNTDGIHSAKDSFPQKLTQSLQPILPVTTSEIHTLHHSPPARLPAPQSPPILPIPCATLVPTPFSVRFFLEEIGH